MEIYTYAIDVYGIGDDVAELPDVTGWDVEALDGHVGKVDEATYDTGASCLVVDTGFWIFGKKRMVPAGFVQRLDVDDQIVHVRLTKQQIKDAPDYDPERHAADEEAYHKEVGTFFQPVM